MSQNIKRPTSIDNEIIENQARANVEEVSGGTGSVVYSKPFTSNPILVTDKQGLTTLDVSNPSTTGFDYDYTSAGGGGFFTFSQNSFLSPVAVTGRTSNIVAVQGNPAFAYKGTVANTVYYTRADTPDGKGTWSTPVQIFVDQPDLYGQSMSLAVIDGRPAVACDSYVSTTGVLAYTRSLDATGLTWPAVSIQVSIPAGSFVGQVKLKELAIPALVPSIGCFEGGNIAISFYKATDADGAGFTRVQLQTNVDNMFADPGGFDFEIVQGQPTFLFRDSFNVARYRRSGNLGNGFATLAFGSATTFNGSCIFTFPAGHANEGDLLGAYADRQNGSLLTWRRVAAPGQNNFLAEQLLVPPGLWRLFNEVYFTQLFVEGKPAMFMRELGSLDYGLWIADDEIGTDFTGAVTPLTKVDIAQGISTFESNGKTFVLARTVNGVEINETASPDKFSYIATPVN